MVQPTRARIGIVINRVSGAQDVLRAGAEVEDLGFGTAWLTNGGPEDCMPLLAALAIQTTHLQLGTSVLQTYPRHPFVVATEANVIDQLAGAGRLRLGVGPSHAVVMESLGLERVAPLSHLREYVAILRTLTQTGSVDFSGEHLRTRGSLGRTFELPIMIGALRPKAFEFAASGADGAITWLCPADYLRAVAVPRMTEAAAAVGRPRPTLVAHLAAAVHENGEQLRDTVRATIPNIAFPAYQRMLVQAGFPDAAGGRWTDQLIDHVIAWGTEDHVAERIRALFAAGADEVLIRPIGAGPEPARTLERTVHAIAAAFD